MPTYKKISKNLQIVEVENSKAPVKKLAWINIVDAGKNEIEYLRKKHQFNLIHLQASSAKILAQRPSLTVSDDGVYSFLILQFPILKNGNIVPAEIDIFKKRGVLVTAHNSNIDSLNEFFNFYKKDYASMLSYKYGSTSILLYEILKKIMLGCYQLLDQSSKKITEAEEIIFSGKQKEAVSQILGLRRNIINFRKIMQSHKNILKKLMERKSIVPDNTLRQLYNELIDHTKTIWDILDNHKEMIEILNDTNESLLNNRLNDIIKTLTIFSVIVFPLTLLAAIFGMNITSGMPFLNTANGFWIIIAIMICGSLGMLLFFEKKKWL